MTQKYHLLIITLDILGERLSGQGLRVVELARALSGEFHVAIAAPSQSTLPDSDGVLVTFQPNIPNELARLVDSAEVILISGFLAQRYPFLGKAQARVVVDLIAPFMLETAFATPTAPLPERQAYTQHAVVASNALAQIGDFFICGSERQRDLWLGMLAANGRLTPAVLASDLTGRNLIDVVSFGVSPPPTQLSKIDLSTLHPALTEPVQIVWWGGGIWDWLDPLTLLKAWPAVVAVHSQARLVLVNPASNPNASVAQVSKADAALALAESLGVLDKSVVFLDWLPYNTRYELLQQAALGIVLHPPHLETHFSVRTRVLDFVGAGLPIVITEGDVMSDLVQQYKLGWVVAAAAVDEVTKALIDLLMRDKTEFADGFAAAAAQLQWSNVVEPLRRYCRTGEYAADRRVRHLAPLLMPKWRGVLLFRLRQVWRTSGITGVIKRSLGYLRRRF